jgi:hypothetical protein
MNDSFIFVNLMGGLGNQMFQYAAGLLHKKETNGVLILCKPHTNIHDTKDYRETVFKNESRYDSDLPPHVSLYQENAYRSWNPSEWKYPVLYLYGYFQNYQTLKPILPEFKDKILTNLDVYKSNMKQKYFIRDSSIFIHVRRGDYGEENRQTIEYYKNALSILLKNSSIDGIFIFSDDLQWCKSQEFFQSLNPTFVDEDVLETVALMSEIHGGAIIANSTLSWMGAYLGCELNNVYYPKRWLTDQVNSINICPNEWIGV